MIFLRSLVFNVYFIVVTLIYSIISCCFFFFPRPFHSKGAYIWAHFVVKGADIICGLKYRLEGLENLPTDKPFILASKHQSAYETYLYNAVINSPAFVLKRSLVMIPIVGWSVLLTGAIPIDRQAGMSAMLKVLHGSENRLKNKQNLVIFPEGTRVKYGEKGVYRGGIALLDSKLDAPVIPVALNSGKFWGKNTFLRHPGTVVVKIMPALPKGLSKKDFLTLLEKTIEEGCQKIN